jgi:iron complex transport system ATP-binding protein
MLSVAGVTVERGGRKLLDGVYVDARPGHVLAILGPNGAGKSSLIRVMSGEWRPQQGSVLIDGVPIARLSAEQLAQRRAVVSQSAFVSFPFTAKDIVKLGMSVPGFALPDDDDLAEAALADVGLDGFGDRRYAELSGGERQRVHIARAVCQLKAATDRSLDQAKTLLLDEPTSNLDPAHQALVLGRARQLAGYGWSVVVVLHDINLAAAWADQVILMRAGRIFDKGDAAKVLTSDNLTTVYGCKIVACAPPADGGVYVLPHHTRGALPA